MIMKVTFNCKMAVAALAVFAGACSSSSNNAPVDPLDTFGASDRFDVPLTGLSAEDDLAFKAGDDLFDLSLRPYDGLGPLYTRSACALAGAATPCRRRSRRPRRRC